MTMVALPWFVLVTTGSASRTILVLAAEVAPMALLGIPSGSLVGRLGARPMMLLSDLLRAGMVVLIPVLARGGAAVVWVVAGDRVPARDVHGAVFRGAAGDLAGAVRRQSAGGVEGVGPPGWPAAIRSRRWSVRRWLGC
jgi:hypothetical protein